MPRKHRYAVDFALWALERDAALERSGLPVCAWMERAEQDPWSVQWEEVLAHVETCPTCEARGEYVRAHVRPEPIGGGLNARIFGIAGRLSGWKQSAFGGAMLLLALGGMSVPALLGMSILRREPALAGAALGLFVVLVVSGAVGGVVHYVSTPLREKGTAGYYASWVLTVYGYLVVAFGCLALGAVLLRPAWGDSDWAEMLSEPGGWIVLLVMGAVFGIVVGRSARDSERVGIAPRERPSWFSSRKVLYALGLLLGVAAALWVGRGEPRTRAEWERELPELREAVRQDQEDGDAQRELAWALAELERWDEALPVLRNAIRLNPRDADLRNAYGWALIQANRYEEALPILREAVRIAPDHSVAQHNLGWTLYNLGRFGEAERAYRQALHRTPQVPNAHSELGWVLIELRRLHEAAGEFREAIRLEPANPGHHRGLAVALMQSGQPAEALEAYREAARLAPNDPALWGEIGRLAHLSGRHREAVAAFGRAEALDSTFFDQRQEERGMREASRAGRQYPP